MSLKFDNAERRYIDVPAPYFGLGPDGKEVVIRVNKKTVKTYIRASKLGDEIRKRTDVEEQDITAYVIAADIITLCTLPDTGEPAFSDKQIDDIVNLMPKKLLEDFLHATFELDPVSLEPVKDLATKKKKS